MAPMIPPLPFGRCSCRLEAGTPRLEASTLRIATC